MEAFRKDVQVVVAVEVAVFALGPFLFQGRTLLLWVKVVIKEAVDILHYTAMERTSMFMVGVMEMV